MTGEDPSSCDEQPVLSQSVDEQQEAVSSVSLVHELQGDPACELHELHDASPWELQELQGASSWELHDE